LVILACTIFDWSTRVMDRWTDGRTDRRTELRWLRCAKAVYLLSRVKTGTTNTLGFCSTTQLYTCFGFYAKWRAWNDI